MFQTNTWSFGLLSNLLENGEKKNTFVPVQTERNYLIVQQIEEEKNKLPKLVYFLILALILFNNTNSMFLPSTFGLNGF